MADRFGLEFVRTHPTDAARVVESMPDAETGRWLDAIPSADAASLISLFAPGRARRYLESLEPKRLEQVIGHVSTELVAGLVRRMHHDARERVLGAMDEHRAEAVRRLLRFPEGTVGAIMDVQPLAVPDGTSVGAVIELVSQAPEDARDTVYLIDANHRLSGAIETHDLLTAGREDSVAGFRQRAEFVLSPRMSLESIDDHKGWTRHDDLPVVDIEQRLLGALSRRALSDALHGMDDDASRHAGLTDAVFAVAETVWDAWAEMFMTDGSPPDRADRKSP